MGASRVILGNMRPKSQLVLKDSALTKPSGLREFLGELKKSESVSGYHYIPAREPQLVDLPAALDPSIKAILADRGIRQLYSHQAAAFASAQNGSNTVVVTPTASGKTLCYNLPVLQQLSRNPDSRALYLYPTKALTYDQLDDLTQWGVAAFSYDGDTPQDARSAVRAKASIVLTNPDMLHNGILPHHTKWARLFENLSFVIVDELHTYRGVFGSHVANVFRRLARVCEFYGSRPQFICTSATIANPKELAENLTA